MTTIQIVGTNVLLEGARSLLKKKEITQAQFDEIEANNRKLPEETRNTLVILE